MSALSGCPKPGLHGYEAYESTQLTSSSQLIARHRVSGAGAIKGLEFAKGGRRVLNNISAYPFPYHLPGAQRRLATNSSDRTIRQFTLPNYPSPPSSSARNGVSSTSTSPPTDITIPQHSISDPNNVSASERSSVSVNAYSILETELEATHKFNDPISKVAWHSMSYSPDGEWLAGGMQLGQ